jgi:hypothetical protein
MHGTEDALHSRVRAILVLAWLSFPPCAQAQAWDPHAEPVHQVLTAPRIRTGHDVPLLSAGVVMFVGGFLGTAVGTSYWYSQDNACTYLGWFHWGSCRHHQLGDNSLAFAFVPIVGPWMMLSDPYLSGASYLWPVVAGLVQDVGFVLMLIGLVDTHEIEVRPRVNVRPMASASGFGLVVDGAF